MILSWVFVYEDADCKGPCTMMFGSDNGMKNNLVEFHDIKDKNQYPPGMNCVLYVTTDGQVIKGVKTGASSVKPAIQTESTKPQKSKSFMKKTFASIIITMSLVLGFSLHAQTYVQGTYTAGCLTLYPASAVTNVGAYNGWIDVRKCDSVALQISFTADAAGTNQVFNFVGSVDGSSVITNDVAFSVVVPYNSITVNRTTTNWNKGGIGYIKLYSWGPNYDADSDVTNVVVKYGYLIK